ncbi:hypothetical protein C455_16685 [Haloferax larsenii JCM 13917]|nr:hypothetical protein C455_16685 [Haloferax larsenii JCM 13917]
MKWISFRFGEVRLSNHESVTKETCHSKALKVREAPPPGLEPGTTSWLRKTAGTEFPNSEVLYQLSYGGFRLHSFVFDVS